MEFTLEAILGTTPLLHQDFHQSSQFRRIVANRFRHEPETAVEELLSGLRNEHKEQLLIALNSKSNDAGARTGPFQNANLTSEIFMATDRRAPHGLLDRVEFAEALRLHRLHEKKEKSLRKRAPVTRSDLLALGISTSIPYIGFGFLDNFIMITAGESIEGAFGVTLGLSIMAAAALGNTISDVAGVIVQSSVEQQQTKGLRILRAPYLSKFQQSTLPVRMTRMVAAIIGVCIGCVLGMVPLLWFKECTETDKTRGHDASNDLK